MIQISREAITRSVGEIDEPYVVYANFFRLNANTLLRELVIVSWADCRFDDQERLQWREFFAVSNEQNWMLFKIANGIVDEEPVEITDDDIGRKYW